MKALVLFHGDCDGVISAGLYIRHFLRDLYPSNIVLRFTHPWRIKVDFLDALESHLEELREVVILDLAINKDLVEVLKDLVARKNDIRITIVDHHSSSQNFVPMLKDVAGIRIHWELVQSTPDVLSKMIKSLNNYERFLIRVAAVCEGAEADDETLQCVADKIKLTLALDPTDTTIMYDTVKYVVEGVEFWNLNEYEKRFYRARWLLTMLLKNIERRAEHVNGWDVVVFSAAESLIYAGLFGIAASEYVKKTRKPIVLIRDEGRKIVVTIRSSEGRALELCKELSKHIPDISYGGHREAASITIYGMNLNDVVDKIRVVLSTMSR